MAVRPAMRGVILISNLLCFVAAAAADPQLPDLTKTVNEITAACAIGPTNSLKETLSSKLQEFLRRSLETKSAKSVDLTDVFVHLPTDTEEALGVIKVPAARQMFFTIYFDCIRHQTSLKLKLLNIAFE